MIASSRIKTFVLSLLPTPDRHLAWPEAAWGAFLYWLALPGPHQGGVLPFIGWVALTPWVWLVMRKKLGAPPGHTTQQPTRDPGANGAAARRKNNAGHCPPPAADPPPCKTKQAADPRTARKLSSGPRSLPRRMARKLSPIFLKPYWQIWWAGFVFWLVTLHWLRYPHPAVSIGWVALSAYLACYLPAFVAICRVGFHRLRLPIALVVPVVWTALEYVRAHLLTGFTLASLAHTQYRWSLFLQVCDLGGQYTLSFVMAAVSAILAVSVATRNLARAAIGTMLGGMIVLSVAVYGALRLTAFPDSNPQLRVLLVQGSVDVVFPPPPLTPFLMHTQYSMLSSKGVETYKNIDLIIWPESVYGYPLVDATPDAIPPGDWQDSPELFRKRLAQACEASRELLHQSASQFKAPLIVGINREEWTAEGPKMYNSAVFVPAVDDTGTSPGATGEPTFRKTRKDASSHPARPQADVPPQRSPNPSLRPAIHVYDKLHLVMFGEYVPYARHLRWILDLRPLSTLQVNTEPGREPKCFVLGKAQMAPNICFESTVPHLIRRQLLFLRDQGYRPNVLVNLTNDGWFRGAAALDLHLACSVLRAVEFRKPHLIAANTGLSAFVDSAGRIRDVGARRQTDLLLAEVTPNDQETLYLRWGDWLGQLCLALTLFVALSPVINQLSGRRVLICRSAG
ncbi:MAG: hypothetical protein NZ899_09475 [Thermoguttaceae bacterium]|nr:hypothetical protein [Thermoguttaceae bacterium]MDW8079318.1 nitrilase-related carbon-nitrogen hydrolase [Thermoguttaceae bacterium]